MTPGASLSLLVTQLVLLFGGGLLVATILDRLGRPTVARWILDALPYGIGGAALLAWLWRVYR